LKGSENLPAKTKPKKAKSHKPKLHTDFPIMLHVDSKGVAHYPHSEGYFDALFQSEQRKNYSIERGRQQEMRLQFDRYVSMPEPLSKSQQNIVKLEAQYGDMIRALYWQKHVPRKQLAKQFKLKLADVRTLIGGEGR